MALSIPPGFGLAALRFACAGVVDPMVTTFGIDWEGQAITGPSVDSDATAIFTLLTGSSAKLLWPERFSTQYTFLGVSLVENRAGVMIQGVSSQAPLAGTTVSECLPPNCAFLVRKGTALAGRKGRGRMFFPPMLVGEGGVGSNGVISGNIIEPQTRLNLFRADLIDGGFPMVLLHKDEGINTVAPTPVTSLSMQMLLATQRRRLR